MRTVLVLLFALLAGCSSLGAQESDVIIGYGNYEYTGPQTLGSAGGSSFLSDPDALFDGRPSTLTRVQWISGAQTTASYTAIEFAPAFAGSDTPTDVPIGVFAILNTSLPPGLKFEIFFGAVGGTPVATSTMELNPDGTTSGIAVFDTQQSLANLIGVQFFNNVAGGTPIAPSDEFTIGEIFVGARADFDIKRTLKQGYANTAKLRLSAANAQWPVLNPPVRQLTVDVVPQPQEETFSGEDAMIDTQTLLTSIMNSNVVCVIPFPTLDPGYYPAAFAGRGSTPSNRLRVKTSFLAQFLQPPTISAIDMSGYYDCNMQLQESI